MRRHNDFDGFVRIVGHHQQIEITGRDLLLAEYARVHPSQESGPVVPAEQDNGELRNLPGLNQRHRLEELIEGAEPSRKDNKGVAGRLRDAIPAVYLQS